MNIQKITSEWAKVLSANVFYMPTIGPVFTHGKSVRTILNDLLEISGTGKILPYDKDRRWITGKSEHIVIREIKIGENWIAIPTEETEYGKRKIFVFGTETIETKNAIYRMSRACPSGNTKVYRNIDADENISDSDIVYNVFLKKFSGRENGERSEKIKLYTDLDEQTALTLDKLGDDDELGGLKHIHREYFMKGKLLPPVVCYVEYGKIVGAIGPISTMVDPYGKNFMPPPYFGVTKKSRRQGIGRTMWHVAMQIAQKNCAEYLLLQADEKAPASGFYINQGCELASKISVGKLKQNGVA